VSTLDETAQTQRLLLTVQESAALVGVSHKTVRRWISSGRLTAYKMGPRLVRIDAAELDGMLRPIPTAAERAQR